MVEIANMSVRQTVEIVGHISNIYEKIPGWFYPGDFLWLSRLKGCKFSMKRGVREMTKFS